MIGPSAHLNTEDTSLRAGCIGAVLDQTGESFIELELDINSLAVNFVWNFLRNRFSCSRVI